MAGLSTGGASAVCYYKVGIMEDSWLKLMLEEQRRGITRLGNKVDAVTAGLAKCSTDVAVLQTRVEGLTGEISVLTKAINGRKVQTRKERAAVKRAWILGGLALVGVIAQAVVSIIR